MAWLVEMLEGQMGLKINRDKLPVQQLLASAYLACGKLDDAINSYRRGVDLKRHCESKLRDAQLKVERIVQGADGTITAEPIKID